jgi:hypothetical protein
MPPDSLATLSDLDVQSAGDVDTPAPTSASESCVFAAATPSDIQTLVDVPCRTLDVEYKSWRNLKHQEDRAELARDIAALANHGGGHIVFGFHEGSLAPEDNHPFWTNCTGEQVTTIVRAYLDPPVHCEVATLRSAIGNLHPVIRVSGHGAVPICSRQDGPLVGNARLLERGAYYVRRHAATQSKSIGVLRPESGRIELPHEWAPLIRRCVRQDRETLLAMIDASIEGRNQAPALGRRLETWHDAAHAAFLALVPRSPLADVLGRRHYALSYGFELIGQEMLEHAQLPELLRRAVFELQPMFHGVLNMFDPPYRRAVQPRFAVDAATGDGETDFLEVAWLRDRPPTETADFWRVSPRGFATIVRDYTEDRAQTNRTSETPPGTRFSPNLLAQEIAELICHARAMQRFFSGVRRVWFHCEWWGLAGRELFDPDNGWANRRPAIDDHRLVTLQMPAASLTQAWPEAVARIIAPVLRAFEPDLALGPDWVRAESAHWANNGAS